MTGSTCIPFIVSISHQDANQKPKNESSLIFVTIKNLVVGRKRVCLFVLYVHLYDSKVIIGKESLEDVI